jgi:hypothetical protein
MLLSTVRPNGINNDDVLDKGRQCFCPAYGEGKGLAVFRSPHICTGNIMYAENVWHEEFKWFNLTNNIVIVNCWDNDWMDRTQGSNMDSGSLLLVSNNKIAAIAKTVDIVPDKGKESECLYPTPVNKIDGDKTLRHYDYHNMAEIDHIIAGNSISQVVNTSQLLNSYYWQVKATHPEQKELLQEIYSDVSICSNLSQVEIDKSKKMYKNLPVKLILSQLCKMDGI